MIPSFTSENAKLRVRRGDRDVGRSDETCAAAERVPLHARDHRRRTLVDRLEHPPHRVRVRDVLVEGELGRRAHPVDVGAGAEARALAGEHDRTRAADVHERLCQLADQRGVERVAPVGTRQRDAQDVAVALDRQIRHTGTLMLRGAIAAALTPLREGRFDEAAVEPYVDFLVAGGLHGALAMGTTGEGMLFDLDERCEIASAFVDAGRDRLQVAVHAGMQSTEHTVALAEHAGSIGADAVAVIPPPYFVLDDDALFAHLAAAARACAPVPFYVYEFERTSGYAVSRPVLERLREAAPNLAGMKVSDTPYDQFARYLDIGLDVFVGPEAFIGRGLDAAPSAPSPRSGARSRNRLRGRCASAATSSPRCAGRSRSSRVMRRSSMSSAVAGCRCRARCVRRCAGSRSGRSTHCRRRWSRSRPPRRNGEERDNEEVAQEYLERLEPVEAPGELPVMPREPGLRHQERGDE